MRLEQDKNDPRMPTFQVRSGNAGGRVHHKCRFKLAVAIPAAVLTSVGETRAQAKPGPESLLTQALEFEKEKDYKAAEGLYKQVLADFPDQPEILTRLGVVLQNQLKYEESIETFQKILKRAPMYPQANIFMGISYYALNLFDKAVAAFNAELVANSKDRQTRYYLALALYALDQKLEAIKQLEELVTDNPADAQASYQLARFYKMSAQQSIQRLATLNPDSQWDHALKGEIYADNDKSEEAIREFHETLKKDPNFPGIHFALGQIYWKKAQVAQAQEELQLAL